MSIYKLKTRFQRILSPILLFLHQRGIKPNAITLSALLGSLIVGLLPILSSGQTGWLVIYPIWLFVRMALNALDGMLARNYKLSTPKGQILNELGDVLSDLFLYLPLAFISSEILWSVILFSIGAVLTEFCGLLGPAMEVTRHYEGPMGKSDRAFLVGLLAVITFVFPDTVGYWNWIFYIATLLSVWTCKNRLINILKEVKGRVKDVG